jgi:ribosomal-protein-alanine N-acetyltransferase
MVHRLERTDLPEAASLVRRVFDAYVAPEYPPEGVRTFYEFLDEFADADGEGMGPVFGYLREGALVGVLAVRGADHISLLFVAPEHHRTGVARALFRELKKEADAVGAAAITVNASRYGLPAYEKLGFVAEGGERVQNGILYTPMRYDMHPEITLRPWRTEDAERIWLLANNPKIAQNLRNAFPHPYSLADAQQYIERSMGRDGDRCIIRTIEIDGAPAGSIGVFLGSDVYEKTAEIGYWLAEPYWGRDIMPRAVREICDLAFDTYDIECIYAEVFGGNPASCRVLEKAGFTREGVKRRGVYKNGRVMDGVLHTLLRGE